MGPTFEESIDIVNREIGKRRNKWTLDIISWLDYEDVSQILRIHIYKKWYQYDPSQPLAPWLNRIISNQIKNILRNVYTNCCRPCLKCAAAEGDDGCRIYQKQCSDCPLFAAWEKSKKSAYNVKLPVSLESHTQEVFDLSNDSIDIERTAKNVHNKMKTVLSAFEWRAYKLLYIDYKTEEETACALGFKTTEEGRKPGYKRVRNIKTTILEKVKEALSKGEIDIVN